MTPKYFVRPLAASDEPIIWEFLLIAAHETRTEAVRDYPKLAMYAANWGREGDGGWAALREEKVVGVVWWRVWRGEERGFGFVDAATPEAAIAVRAGWQNRGVGTLLLKRAIQECPRISLNVRGDNAAVRLYERCGFERIEGSERLNRVGGISFNMLRR